MNQNAPPAASATPQIFDSRKRSAKMNRAKARVQAKNQTQFIWDHIADEFCERLAAIKRRFDNVLITGPMTHYKQKFIDAGEQAIHHDAVIILDQSHDEDALPYEIEQFDAIITGGTLDGVNDLPGALIQMRRFLKADGLLLGSIFGSGSLSTVKSIMMAADGDAVRPHIHPQIDIRTMADLLVRAGLKLPVADRDTLNIRYSDLLTLVNDIRDMGLGNSLSADTPPISRTALYRAFEKWTSLQEDDGKVTEKCELIHFNGWAPSPDQPKPAKRGSGKMSLADALKPKGD